MKLIFKALLAGLFALAMTSAYADPIGPPNCGSCAGNVFTLEYVVVNDTHYQVTLTIDTTSYIGPDTDWIQSVAIKPASQVLATSTLTSTTAPGIWASQLGGLNAAGCDGAGSGFICAQSASNLAVTDGSTYQWLFDVYVADAGKWTLGTLGASVKANYDPATGRLTSEDITLQPLPLLVPEPQSLALLGLGLLILFAVRRKQRR